MTNWPGDEELLREPEIKASNHPDGLLARTEQRIRDILKADSGIEAKDEDVTHKMVVHVEPSFYKAVEMYISGYYISKSAWIRMVLERAMKHGW